MLNLKLNYNYQKNIILNSIQLPFIPVLLPFVLVLLTNLTAHLLLIPALLPLNPQYLHYFIIPQTVLLLQCQLIEYHPIAFLYQIHYPYHLISRNYYLKI
jgi:hypothetical protein